MATCPTFLTRLQASIAKPNVERFIMADVRVLLHTSKFSGWLQQRAYLWMVAMTRSRGCIGDQAQDSTEPLSTQEWMVLLDCSERHAIEFLQDGTDRGLFKRRAVSGRGYRYQPCPASKLAEVPEPVKAPVVTSEDEPEGEQEPEPTASVDEAGVVTIPPIIVQSKATTKAIDLTTAIHQVRYHNDSELGFSIGLRAEKGVLFVQVAIPKILPQSAKGEQKGMNPCAPAQGGTRVLSASAEDERRRKGDEPLRSSSGGTKVLEVGKRRRKGDEPLRSSAPPLRPELREKIQDVFTSRGLGPIADPLWDKICSALGHTPDEWMTETVTQKLSLRRHYTVDTGLFVNFAQDAATRCNDWVSKLGKSTPASSQTSPAERTRMLAYALDELAANPGDAVAQTIIDGATPDELEAARSTARSQVGV